MRLNVFLITIILGVLFWGGAFFVFIYPIQTPAPQVHAGGSAAQTKTENSGGQAFLLPISESIANKPVRDFNIPNPVINAKAAVLFDVKSNSFLFEQNPNRRLPIASITKLMSAVVAIENLNPDQAFTVPAESINVDGNGAVLYRGEQLRLSDLLKIMLIKSSNDAAFALANGAQKLGIDFVEKMNQKAQNIGMLNTKFADPAGLDDHGGFSTAADLVKLVRYAQNLDFISQTLKEQTADVWSLDGSITHHLINTDQLLGHISDIVLGKTGYTDLALGTMALSVRNGNSSLVSIILGSEDRFGETRNLIDWARKAYAWK